MSTCITGGKLASCLLLLFLGASAVQAQPVVISERLGEVIDADERAYFGLFPRIDAFVSATAHQQEGDSVVFVITQADPEDFISDKQYVGRIAKKWHLALSLQVPVSQAEMSYVEAIGSGTSNQIERAASLSKLVLSTRLDYSLGTRVRLGAGYHRFINENLPSFQDGVIGSYAEHREAFTDLARSGGFVNVSGNLFFSHVVLALKPFDAYTYLREVAPVAFSSLELRLGAGPSIGFLEVDQGFQSGYINNETAYSYSNHSEYQLTQVGVTAVAEGDFYVSRSFSIGIGLQGFHFPNLEVREYTLAVPIGTFGGSRKSVLPASSTLQYIDATVGVRLHF